MLNLKNARLTNITCELFLVLMDEWNGKLSVSEHHCMHTGKDYETRVMTESVTRWEITLTKESFSQRVDTEDTTEYFINEKYL